jgi:hypothetical protein
VLPLKILLVTVSALSLLQMPPPSSQLSQLSSMHKLPPLPPGAELALNVQLPTITVDTDTTVHTLYGNQMGGRKGYNPRNKGKKSYQPILTFIAETREYISGELHNGDRPDGKQIARHLAEVLTALPGCVRRIFARADSGFYCWQAVEAYEKAKAEFIMVARKTSRLVEQLQAADWKPSPQTDADQQCKFCYPPEGWSKAYRFIALRYRKDDPKPTEREQYQLFDTSQYLYRVCVTNMDGQISTLVCSTINAPGLRI